MPNRNQDNQSGRRYPGNEDERDYGSYADTDEGDSSVRAGSYDRGRDRPNRNPEQQGRSGRFSGYGDFGQGDYGGGRGGNLSQDRFRGGEDGGAGSDSRAGFGGGSRSFSGYGYEGSSWRGESGSRGQGDAWNARGGRDQGGPRGQGEWSRHSERPSQSGFSGYGGSSGWNEPYGEGQQYSSGGRYASQSGQQSGDWGQPTQWGQSGQWGQSRQSRNQYGYGGTGVGQHYGKGPKGYQRSDDRIKELICERLHDDPEIDPSDVTITVQGGKVTLDGTVDSRHVKNVIEDVAEQFGVQDVQNNLRVQKGSLLGGDTDTRSTMSTRQNKH